MKTMPHVLHLLNRSRNRVMGSMKLNASLRLIAISIFVLVSSCQKVSVAEMASPGHGLEVVPASQFTNGVSGYREKAWISEAQGLAVTSAAFQVAPSRTAGGIHVWSLRTGLVQQTINTPAMARVIAGDGRTPLVFVAGGPTVDADSPDDKEFVWMVNLETGRRVRELPLWSRNEAGGLSDGALSKDKTKLVLQFTTRNCAIYDLAKPDAAPIPGGHAWESLVEPEKEILRRAPNWMDKCGASDGALRLGSVKGHGAVWRGDTGEELTPLGFSDPGVRCWVPSADGSVLLGVRESSFLLLDLKSWRVIEWREPRIPDSVQPALTSDGSVVRFAREAGDGRLEIVSRDWRSGVERVDISMAVPRQDNILQKAVVFSDDGMAVAIAGSKGLAIARWNQPGLSNPLVTESTKRLDHIAGITCDASTVYYLTRKGVTSNYQVHAWNVRTGRSEAVMNCYSVEFEPEVVLQSLPSVSGEILSARGDSGTSLQTRAKSPDVWHQEEEARDERFHSGLRSAAYVHPSAGERVLLKFYDSAISTHDAVSGRKLAEFRSERLWSGNLLQQRVAAPLVGRVFAGLDHGGVQILDVQPGGALTPVAQVWSPTPGSWLVVLPDGRYAASPEANPPVFFRRAGRLYPFEEFDAEFNQPHAVAETLGAIPSAVAELRRLWERRQVRLRLPSEPSRMEKRSSVTLKTLTPLIHDQPMLAIDGTVQAAEAAVIALDLYVNDVPVFGTKGRPLAAAARGSAPFNVEVPLVPGANKIQLAARDAAGGVSLRETFRVHRSARGAMPRRFVLAIGVADYDDDRLDLQYAAKDAQDVARALTTVKGRFTEARSLVLADKKARRADILAAGDFLRQTRPEDEVIVFVSGHGAVNAQGDYFFCAADFRPEDMANGVSFRDLENLFDGIPALTRLLLVDSCHSGELTDEQVREVTTRLSGTLAAKGVRLRPAGSSLAPGGKSGGADGAAREIFLDLRRTTGATVLSASGGLEFAMEDAVAKNGLFTHCLLAALASPGTDANHDGEVTASELIQATAKSVEELTNSQQRPNARFTNRAVDFSIASGRNTDIPGGPEDVVRHFIEWVSVGITPLPPRLGTCFAPEFLYFGQARNFAAIETAHQDFRERFPLHHDRNAIRIKRLVASVPEADGAVTVRSEVSFHVPSYGRFSPDNHSLGKTPERFGDLQLEAVLRPLGHEWKIVSLRTLGVPQARNNAPPAESNAASVWVFPASSERLLEAAEITRLTARERRRSRNEIYARHGLIFSTPEGKAFARSLGSAYREVAKDVSVIERGFNRVERANVLLIKSLEK